MQHRPSRSQLAGHPPSPLPPVPLDDPPLLLEPPRDPLLELPRPPLELLLEPPELEPPEALSNPVPPSVGTPKSPSPVLMLPPPSSPALFGELLHAANAANATTAALHTTPSFNKFAIAHS
jgi:hypothetical protein